MKLVSVCQCENCDAIVIEEETRGGCVQCRTPGDASPWIGPFELDEKDERIGLNQL